MTRTSLADTMILVRLPSLLQSWMFLSLLPFKNLLLLGSIVFFKLEFFLTSFFFFVVQKVLPCRLWVRLLPLSQLLAQESHIPLRRCCFPQALLLRHHLCHPLQAYLPLFQTIYVMLSMPRYRVRYRLSSPTSRWSSISLISDPAIFKNNSICFNPHWKVRSARPQCRQVLTIH